MIVHELDDEERREAYAADVTYGTNNEFGFDYLRDNMKFDDPGIAPRRSLRQQPRSASHAPAFRDAPRKKLALA